MAEQRLIDAGYAREALHYIPWIDSRATDEVIDKCPTVDVTELLDMERDRITADTLRNYHAWLLEEFRKNPTSDRLHSIDTAISWLKAYGEYKDINVCFGVERG